MPHPALGGDVVRHVPHRSGLTPEINALATLALLAAMAIGAALVWLTRTRPAP